MANNPWDVSGSFDSGFQSSLDLQKIKLEKQRQANELIKQKFEMMQKNYQHAWEVVKDPQLPGSTKVAYWNNIISPYDNNVLGVKTPPMTKWNDELQSHVEQAAHVVDLVSDGKLTPKEGKLAYNHIQGEVASNPQAASAFKSIDSTLSELSGGAPIPVNVGGKTVMASKNINGGYDPVQVTGMGAGVAPSQLSVEQDKNRQDSYQADVSKFQEAAKIIAGDKEGILDKILPSLTPEQREQAIREANASLYIVGGHLGMSAKTITGVVTGNLDSNKVLADVGKQFALSGTKSTNPADSAPSTPPVQSLPGLTVTPKVPAPTQSQAPAPADAPQVAALPAAASPAPQAPVQDPAQGDVTQTASATSPDDKEDEANV